MEANYNHLYVEKQLEAPMPWIGLYVAVASLVCSVAMAADAFHGFRSKKLWFPSKYFSLNATSLALLTVALKLPVDLTTNMWAATDRLAKISSIALMTTAMANFMPSLGSMTDEDILFNVTALGILVLTVIADICIQVVGTWSFLDQRMLFPEEIMTTSLMLLLLLVLGSSAIMALTTKRFLEAKYQDKHDEDIGDVSADRLRDLVKKYWVMAETSSPQFVIARSATSATSGVICLASALILGQAIVRTCVAHKSLHLTASSYGSSTKWILLAQTIGVIVGTTATSVRWCTAIRLRCSAAAQRSLKDELKVEEYWTRMLKEYQESSLYPRIRHPRCRRIIYKTRGVIVNFVVGAQALIVLFKKLVLVISCFVASLLIKFIENLKEQPNLDSTTRYDAERESVSGDIISNVQSGRRDSLRLEGEADLPDYTLKRICNEVNEVIKTGGRQKPSGLLQLLQKSINFNGVAEFDNDRVQRLHDREPKNCWSLPVVTLTSIAIALPNTDETSVDQLVSDVSDGLSFIKMVEKSFYRSAEWKNIRKAADVWLRVNLFREWQEIKLREISGTSRNPRQALGVLVEESRRIASELKTGATNCPMSNPVNWPARVIAANSMYRISKTILQTCNDEESAQTEERLLFEKLSVMIADILAACLTNLARVITTRCRLNAIEKRGKRVQEAARLLGKTEDIIEFLRPRLLQAGMEAEKAAYIEEWREKMKLQDEAPPDAITSSRNETNSELGSNRSSVAITLPVECIEQAGGGAIPEFSVSCNSQHREDVAVRLVPAASTDEMAVV